MIYGGCNCGNCHMTILPTGDVYKWKKTEIILSLKNVQNVNFLHGVVGVLPLQVERTEIFMLPTLNVGKK